MAILNNSNAISSAGGYDINNSLRLRKSASAYLSRTLGTPTDGKLWTWSGWVKRGALGSDLYGIQHAFSATNIQGGFYFQSDAFVILDFPASVNCNIVTTQVFRDPSAWYHLVVAVDTTQATASNRVKIYVNGSQITAFSTATYPTQNTIFRMVTSGNSGSIGRYYDGTSYYFDGYLAEYNFIDGQALTPSSFGETDTTTGVWKPKAYSGTYGTNGFYLKFSDIATTSGSNAGLGKDFSGNSNYWTTNNISVTSGTTYDAMTDVPTNTSATVANYCVWNPINNNNTNTITNGNLSGSNNGGTYATMSLLNGKYYWEYYWTSGTAIAMGISPTNRNIYFSNVGSGAVSYFNDGQKSIDGTNSSYGASYTTSDVIGVALDTNAGTITFYKNNVSQGAISLPSGITEWVASIWSRSGTVGFNANFGQQPFTYTPPTGFNRLNTYNLPDSTIKKGNSYMDATLYTGNGSAGTDVQTVVNAGQFKPDLVWTKSRSNAISHHIGDSVRGIDKTLFSNTTGAEATYTYDIHAFNSNGFTVGNDGSQNTSGYTYVGWQWQAGQGSTSSNTSGSITSTVSVNTTAGFSVVTWTGNGTVGATVGHSLGVAPKMVIMKRRNGATNWQVWITGFNATTFLFLQSTNAVSTAENYFNSTLPSSTLLTLSANSEVNASGGTYVAYCWAEIAGFSKFGSYTGNGSTDGPFIATNFAPKFVLIKSSSDAGTDWWLMDSARSPYNIRQNLLSPNTSSAENASVPFIDFLSNGFKIRTATAGWNNTNGSTYIYACFAENPFKNSLAR